MLVRLAKISQRWSPKPTLDPLAWSNSLYITMQLCIQIDLSSASQYYIGSDFTSAFYSPWELFYISIFCYTIMIHLLWEEIPFSSSIYHHEKRSKSLSSLEAYILSMVESRCARTLSFYKRRSIFHYFWGFNSLDNGQVNKWVYISSETFYICCRKL